MHMESSQEFVLKVLMDVDRLRFLRQFIVMRHDDSDVYDRMTELVSRIIQTPIALVTLVTDDFQFFKSQVGVGEPWKTKGGTPLAYSFCQYAVAARQPFVVEDARIHELVRTNPAVEELNVISYLGIPLALHNGVSLGSFGIVDHQPRQWAETEIQIMQELAEILIIEFETRARVHLWQATPDDLASLRNTILHLINSIDLEQTQVAILHQIKVLRTEFDLS
jgi:GAF domain-containing protein